MTCVRSPAAARLGFLGGALPPHSATARRFHWFRMRAAMPSRPKIFLRHCRASRAPARRGPFLNAIFFLMLNRDLPPLALAQYLARARFGHWSEDRRTFFTLDYHWGQGLLTDGP